VVVLRQQQSNLPGTDPLKHYQAILLIGVCTFAAFLAANISVATEIGMPLRYR
jgi:hypothetical protein